MRTLLDRLKLKLIDNWRDAWRFASVWLAALLALLDVAFDYLPAMQTYLPANWVQVLAALIILARIVRQPALERRGS